jgi:hypothetical protein
LLTFLVYSDWRGYKGVAESKEVILLSCPHLVIIVTVAANENADTISLHIELQTAGTHIAEIKHEGSGALVSMTTSSLLLQRASCNVNTSSFCFIYGCIESSDVPFY